MSDLPKTSEEQGQPLDLISIGECMVELYGEQAIEEEPLLRCTVGGDALNVAVAAARIGGRTGFITRVGEDIFAPLLLGRWSAEGVDLSAVKIVAGFNGLYVITVQPDGERSFTYYRRGDAAATLEPADIPADYLARARMVHISGITQAISPSARAAVRRVLELCAALGVPVSYDPNFRPALWTPAEARRELEATLCRVTVALPSASVTDEALWGTMDAEAIARYCLEAGCKVVAVKMGEEGCVVADANVCEHVPAVTGITVRDTTGAGDAFDGAFLLALVRGSDVIEAARLGNLVAAIKCCGRGALGNLPDADMVRRLWREKYDDVPPQWL